ncbi:MAG: ABC transporter substrate-binding protein [Treponema sp.]|nr:ABC transporter substrate-binding protein [Treponema sp.]
MMKKLMFLVLIAVLSVNVFAGGRRQQTSGMTIRPGVLTIGMEIGYPPMEYYGPDGQTPMGFDVDMGKAIAGKLGLQVEFVDTAWDGIFAAVQTNRIDAIMSSVTITPARQQVHNFSRPYIANAMTIVVRKDSAFKPRNPAELQGRGVAFQAETTAQFFLEALSQQTGLRYTPFAYDRVMSCFDELRLNRVDVIVTDGVVAGDYAAPADSIFEITWQGDPDEFFGVCMRGGNDALTEAINQALIELFQDGTMQRISMQHLGIDMVTPARNTW